MNRIILKGNCGSDPEIKTFDWGKVAKFSLATSESYKNKEGQKITETTWHNLVFKGAVCDVLSKYVHKGDQILVEGKIVYRTWKDRNQVDHWATEIVCDNFEFCGSTKKPEESKSNKVSVTAMSDISELPGYVNDGDVPDESPF